MIPLTRDDTAAALRELGLRSGDIVFLHSSLRSMGTVDGGSDAVVDAFLEVLGSKGTLAVPVFTFCHGKNDNPVFVRNLHVFGKLSLFFFYNLYIQP